MIPFFKRKHSQSQSEDTQKKAELELQVTKLELQNERLKTEIAKERLQQSNVVNLHKAIEPTPNFKPEYDRGYINNTVGNEARRIRDQLRHLEANNQILQAILEALLTLYLGSSGIMCSPQPRLLNGKIADALAAEIKRKWREFGVNVTGTKAPTGRLSIYQLQAYIIKRAYVDGDCFVVINEDRVNSTFKLHVKTSEWLGYNLNSNTPPVILDPVTNEVTAFKFYAYNQNRSGYSNSIVDTNKFIVVDSEDVLAFTHKREPEQFRGISPLASAIIPLQQLETFKNSVLTSEVISSSIIGVSRQITATPPARDMYGEVIDQDQELSFEKLSENFGLLIAPDNRTIELAENKSSAERLAVFTAHLLHQIAGAVGLPYEVVSTIYSSSYSAARGSFKVGEVNFERKVEDVVAMIMRPLYRRYVEFLKETGQLQHLTNEIDLDTLYNADFRSGCIPPIDPLKETRSVELMLKLGLISHEEACKILGYNFTDVVAGIGNARRILEENGLTEIWQNICNNLTNSTVNEEELVEETTQEQQEETNANTQG